MMSLALQATLRAARRYRGTLLTLGWVGFGILSAAGRRGEGSDAIVITVLGGLVVPLIAFSLVTGALSGQSYAAAVTPLLRLGAPRRDAALGPLVVATVGAALLSALVAAITIALTRDVSSRPFDAFTTAWIAALGGAAYSAFFLAGSAFGKNGGGRSVALALDFVLGAGGGLGGALTVRGHLRNLLGGSAPLELGQRASFVVLVLIFFAMAALAFYRLLPRKARIDGRA